MRTKRETSPKTQEEIKQIKKLGSKISEFAASKKISIERLAYEAGVSKGYLYDLVKGKGNPSVTILLRICDALDKRIRDLFLT